MAVPTLWISAGACSLAPHIVFRESKQPFGLNIINVKAGFPKEHLDMNNKGRVPILDLGDGNIITEVPAIMTYISQLVPDMHLLGKTPLETVRVYEWLNWLSGTVHAAGFGGLFRPARFLEDESLFGALRAKARISLHDSFEKIEGRLNGRYAMGDSFTVVDAFLLVFYRWGNTNDFEMQTRYPKYTALAEEIVQRPAVVAALEKEGIGALRQ